MTSTRAAAVRRAFEAFLRLDRSCVDGECDGTMLAARELHEAANGVRRIGCGVEGSFLRQLATRLPRFAGRERLSEHLCRCGALLEEVPWVPAQWLRDGARAVPVFLVRHAESTGNVERRLQGSRIGGALTQRGHAQSSLTAQRLVRELEELRAGNPVLVSSPGERAVETTRALAQALGCTLQTHPGLAEIDFGDWTGRYFADLERDAGYAAWMKEKWFRAPPGGESLFEVRSRVFEAMPSLLGAASAKGAPLVIVTHFFPLLALLSAFMDGKAIMSDNGSITRVEYESGAWRATLTNCVAHLGAYAAAPVAYV